MESGIAKTKGMYWGFNQKRSERLSDTDRAENADSSPTKAS